MGTLLKGRIIQKFISIEKKQIQVDRFHSLDGGSSQYLLA